MECNTFVNSKLQLQELYINSLAYSNIAVRPARLAKCKTDRFSQTLAKKKVHHSRLKWVLNKEIKHRLFIYDIIYISGQ